MDYHLSAVVKGNVEMPGEITANNRFCAKHTDDSRILSPLSQIRNFYFAKIGWSKNARCLISEFIPEVAVWRFAIGHETFGNNQIAIKAGIQERLNGLSTLVEGNSDGNVGKTRAGKCRLSRTHNHLPTARSPILKMKLPGPNVVFACCIRSKTVSAISVLPS
jgi:hypothetical protein